MRLTSVWSPAHHWGGRCRERLGSLRLAVSPRRADTARVLPLGGSACSSPGGPSVCGSRSQKGNDDAPLAVSQPPVLLPLFRLPGFRATLTTPYQSKFYSFPLHLQPAIQRSNRPLLCKSTILLLLCILLECIAPGDSSTRD